MSNVSPRIALVTGASRGIGRAIAEDLARQGILVGVHYGSNAALADEVVAGISRAGGTAVALGADLATPDGAAGLAAAWTRTLTERFGAPAFDILVNNAGIAAFAPFGDTAEDTFDRLFAVNVRSLFFLTQRLAPHLRDGGRIINVSSVVARTFFDGIPAYAATKGAVDTLTLQLAPLFGARRITVNSVAPGAIDTDMSAWVRSEQGEATVRGMQAIPRVGTGDDVARVVRFLASPDSEWVTGQVLNASGGTKL